MPTLKRAPRVGNDVIDLGSKEARGKARDARFCERVFTTDECAAIAAAPDPDLLLWSLWAAKETAYKIACKGDSPIPFAPRSYEAERPSEVVQSRRGIVTTAERRFLIRWESTADWIHCLGWEEAEREPQLISVVAVAHDVASRAAASAKPLSDRELATIHSSASRAVRLLAKELLRARLTQEIEILRLPEGNVLGAPRLHVEGVLREDFDLSLSHDGRFVAAAISTSGSGIGDE